MCFWLTGDPGVGKSRYVKSFKPYMKAINKWWDGYNNEPDVLIDDWEIDSLEYLHHYIKLWADPFGEIKGEIKGGMATMCYQRLWVTSNYTIEECV